MIPKITTSTGRPILSKRQSQEDIGKYSPPDTDQDNEDTLLEAVNKVSSYVQSTSREVHLYVDESSGDRQVTVVDSHTGQTIRHIPPEEVMMISRHISSQASDPLKGMLVKSKA